MAPATRWGIVSAGRISNDYTAALKSLPSTEHEVVAIAARNLADAQQFAKKFGIPKAYGSYEEIAQDPDIDIIYVGSIHPTHTDLCKMMLRAGKHVLCEKPITINSKQLKEVLAVAKETGKLIAEGFWSRYFPVYERVRQELQSGSIGDVRVVSAELGFSMLDRPRIHDKALGGGALLDVGCYSIQFADFVFGGVMPEKISATGILQETGADDTVVMTLTYPGNKMAVLSCSASCNLANEAIIRGTKGIIRVPYMWCPTDVELPSGPINYPLPKRGEGLELNFPRSEGFQYEAQKIRESLLQGHEESPYVTHQVTSNIMAIMDEVRRQIGVVYDVDS